MGLIMHDYRCSDHGTFEKLVDREENPAELECPVEGCANIATRQLGAVFGRVKLGEVTQGKSDPHPKQVLDTRALGDGMPKHEWQKKRDQYAKDKRWARVKEAMA